MSTKVKCILGLPIFLLLTACATTSLPETASGRGIYEALPITPRTPDAGLCWDRSQAMGAPQTWEETRQINPMSASSGSRVLHGIGYDDISPATYVNGIFEVPVETALNVTYHMLYLNDEEPEAEQIVRHIVLLNERQMRGAINGEEGIFHDVLLKSREESTLNIEVPPLEPGVNEIIVLSIINPMNDPFSTEFYAHRATLIVGEPEPVFTRIFNNLDREDHNVTVTINLSLGERLKDWNWPEEALQADQAPLLEYFIEVGYLHIDNAAVSDLPNPPTARFAVITMLNYEQIDVLEGTSVYYAEVSSDTQVAQINAALAVPETRGRHHLLAIRIDNPGIPTCILQGPPDGYFLAAQVYADTAWIDVQ